MDRLHTFAVDKVMRTEVKDYLIEFLAKEVVVRAFAGQDVKDLAEARNCINRCFAQMDKEFGVEYTAEVINEQL